MSSAIRDNKANKRMPVSAAKETDIESTAVPAAPPTPVTTTTSVNMDSEEEIMSGLSSDDELMNNDSGDDMSVGDDISAEEGMLV